MTVTIANAKQVEAVTHLLNEIPEPKVVTLAPFTFGVIVVTWCEVTPPSPRYYESRYIDLEGEIHEPNEV